MARANYHLRDDERNIADAPRVRKSSSLDRRTRIGDEANRRIP
jgi:hypothetical protein